MRENRLYGSEGGEAKSLPDPYHGSAASLSRLRHASDAAENSDYTTFIANRRYTNWGRDGLLRLGFAMTGRGI